MAAETGDPLVRNAAQDRRASLKALGALGLATALTAPSSATANKRCKKAKQKAKKECRQQDGACRAVIDEFCQGDPGCHTDLHPCCVLLKSCDAGGAVECFIEGFLPN